jgi:hypothetical protein
MTKINAAIFYLTQNTAERKQYLKTSLYFTFKYFNEKFKYPIIILHEGDYDSKSQSEILTSIRNPCRDCVTFRTIDKDDFKIPEHVDKKKMQDCVNLQVVPYWRNERYRLMCRWWLVHFPKYTKGYDYVMRLDDDSFIEEPVPDLFEWMNDNKYIYTSNILNIDCGICCYGMKDFFEKHFSNKKEIIDKLFIEKDIPSKTFQLFKFRSLLSIMNNTMKIEDNLKLPMPIMFYNNFFITKTSFWERTDVKALVDKVDKDGSIFYYRWGDAPLQTIIVKLLAKDTEVKQSIFKYSKRLQRESFTDPFGDFHSYLPELYSQSSCITEMNPIP